MATVATECPLLNSFFVCYNSGHCSVLFPFASNFHVASKCFSSDRLAFSDLVRLKGQSILVVTVLVVAVAVSGCSSTRSSFLCSPTVGPFTCLSRYDVSCVGLACRPRAPAATTMNKPSQALSLRRPSPNASPARPKIDRDYGGHWLGSWLLDC